MVNLICGSGWLRLTETRRRISALDDLIHTLSPHQSFSGDASGSGGQLLVDTVSLDEGEIRAPELERVYLAECQVMRAVLRLKCQVDEFQFRDACVMTYEARLQVRDLFALVGETVQFHKNELHHGDGGVLHSRGGTGSTGGSGKRGQAWAYLGFYEKLLEVQRERMAVVFWNVIKQQPLPDPFRSALPTTLSERMNTFCHDRPGTHIGLLFEIPQDLSVSYHPDGYVCLETQLQYHRPTGIFGYPFVFVTQGGEDPMLENRPNIVSILQFGQPELGESVQPVSFFDKKLNQTYFISRVSDRLFVVVMCQGKQDRESLYLRFIADVTQYMNCVSVFRRIISK